MPLSIYLKWKFSVISDHIPVIFVQISLLHSICNVCYLLLSWPSVNSVEVKQLLNIILYLLLWRVKQIITKQFCLLRRVGAVATPTLDPPLVSTIFRSIECRKISQVLECLQYCESFIWLWVNTKPEQSAQHIALGIRVIYSECQMTGVTCPFWYFSLFSDWQLTKCYLPSGFSNNCRI